MCSLSFFDVRTDIGHANEGEFLEFFIAMVTDLRIYKDKIDDFLIDILNECSVISINLNFIDKSCKAYNVRWKSDNRVRNGAQEVEDLGDVLRIMIH